MADTFDAVALRGYSLHTPKGFIIFNKDQETVRIPNEHRERLVREGVVDADPLDHDGDGERGGSAKGPASTRSRGKARKAAADDFDPAPFTVAPGKGIGVYDITGPGLDEAESVKGKAKMQARVAELQKAAAGGGDASVD